MSRQFFILSLLGSSLFLAILVILITGCEPAAPPLPLVEGGYEQSHPHNLPLNANVVEDLGNGWIIFSLNVDGEDRRFLYKYETEGAGDSLSRYATIAEIAPRKP